MNVNEVMLKDCQSRSGIACEIVVSPDGTTRAMPIKSNELKSQNPLVSCENTILAPFVKQKLRWFPILYAVAFIIIFSITIYFFNDIQDAPDIGQSIATTWIIAFFIIGNIVLLGIVGIIHAISYAVIRSRFKNECKEKGGFPVFKESKGEKLARGLGRGLVSGLFRM